MNRSLVVSAGCSLLTFLALVAVFHGAIGRKSFAESTQLHAPLRRGDHGALPFKRDFPAENAPHANDALPLSIENAEQSLKAIVDEYLLAWREWETSPRRLYSRAAPRPIPTMYANIAMSPSTLGESDGFLVAAITVGTAAHPQVVPCVVDRSTNRCGFFVDGHWLTEDEWLKSALLPHSTKRR
jgi:hypothetical protein